MQNCKVKKTYEAPVCDPYDLPYGGDIKAIVCARCNKAYPGAQCEVFYKHKS